MLWSPKSRRCTGIGRSSGTPAVHSASQSAIASPISSGLSSWTKWMPTTRHLGLVRPASAELALLPDEDRAGVGVDEQLRDLVGGQPVGVGLDDLDTSRPVSPSIGISRGQVSVGRRPSPARRTGRRYSSISSAGEAADDRARQHRLDEQVLLEEHLLAGLRADALEDAVGRSAASRPTTGSAGRSPPCRRCRRPGPVAVGPVEAERRAPVVDHQRRPRRRGRAWSSSASR